MFAAAFGAPRQMQDGGFVGPGQRDHRHYLGLAFGQRAGFVHHQGIDLFHTFERFRIPDQDAGLRAAADADHDRHRRSESQRAGAGDNEHAHRRHQRVSKARLRTERGPGRECRERNRDHQRHEPGGHLVGETLDRRAAALRGGHHLHDLGQKCVAADLVGAHDKAAGEIDGAADDAGVFVLGHRHGFAGHHRLIERGVAFEHAAVDRHLVAGAHAQLVADVHGIERDLLVAAIVFDAARGLWREIEQRADRAGGCLARAQFQHLADQHQHGDHAGGLEVDRGRAVGEKSRREEAGRERGDDAVDVGDASAHADQREHVEVARDQRLRAAHEERPAGPQHHGRGESELNPVGDRRREPVHAEVAAHLDHHHRQCQHEADPEAPRHVGELGIGTGGSAWHLWLERHAADRARARTRLADLWMHRAGVDRAFDDGRRFARLQVLLRIGNEFRAAAGGAEEIGVAVVIGAMLGSRRIDAHAADRVDFGSGRRVRVMMLCRGAHDILPLIPPGGI